MSALGITMLQLLISTVVEGPFRSLLVYEVMLERSWHSCWSGRAGGYMAHVGFEGASQSSCLQLRSARGLSERNG